jgi:hypothetical protein
VQQKETKSGYFILHVRGKHVPLHVDNEKFLIFRQAKRKDEEIICFMGVGLFLRGSRPCYRGERHHYHGTGSGHHPDYVG